MQCCIGVPALQVFDDARRPSPPSRTRPLYAPCTPRCWPGAQSRGSQGEEDSCGRQEPVRAVASTRACRRIERPDVMRARREGASVSSIVLNGGLYGGMSLWQLQRMYDAKRNGTDCMARNMHRRRCVRAGWNRRFRMHVTGCVTAPACIFCPAFASEVGYTRRSQATLQRVSVSVSPVARDA